jgi:putative sterol carrier protein
MGTTVDKPLSLDTLSGSTHVASLEGVQGRIRFIGPAARVMMQIDDGRVTLLPDEGPADCQLASSEPGDLVRLVTGELNPVTAALQGRVRAEGNLMLVLKVAGSLPELVRPTEEKPS